MKIKFDMAVIFFTTEYNVNEGDFVVGFLINDIFLFAY